MKNLHLLNQLWLSQKQIPTSRSWSGESARLVFSAEKLFQCALTDLQSLVHAVPSAVAVGFL